jgi:ABC-2 type transport system permease protein
MNKILLVIKREYLSRVKKKSFLLSTILTPLIIPLLLGGIFYFATKNNDEESAQMVEILDETGKIKINSTERYDVVYVQGTPEVTKLAFQESDHKALLHIPETDLDDPEGIVLYTKTNLSLTGSSDIERAIESAIEDIKLEESGLDKEVIDNLNSNISLRAVNLSESGEETESSAGLTFGIGYITGFMIYLLIFIYGAQIMHGVLEEKTSRVVEVLISSVKPYYLLMGKVLGIAAVGLTQLFIWILLVTFLSTAVFSYFGVSSPQEMAMDNITQNIEPAGAAMESPEVQQVMNMISSIPFGMIAITFMFYFVGGYLLYGAMFAAVGSAVDSQADAQQFMFPITIPIIIAFIGLSVFILDDPDSSASFWLSIIPFTSPIAMMGRIAFGIPMWELILSMVLLIAGFMGTIWVAARIYRIGILTHGTKISYKVLGKWIMMKN